MKIYKNNKTGNVIIGGRLYFKYNNKWFNQPNEDGYIEDIIEDITHWKEIIHEDEKAKILLEVL